MVGDYVGHGVHVLVVLSGLVGVVLVLAPALLHRPEPVTSHALRVAVLRERVAAGGLVTADPLPVRREPHPVRTPSRVEAGSTPLLVAVFAGAAAAGVHAAVTPAHLGEGMAVGMFFVLTAAGQCAWSCAVLWRPARALLHAGAVANLGVVLVWMVSRTTGVPGVGGGEPEAVGMLDVATTGWELVLIACCLRLLAQPALPRPSLSWREWPPAAQCWTAVTVGVLGALTLLDLHT